MSTDQYRRITIKDCTYTIQLLDGDASLTAFGTLAKYLAGPLGYVLAGRAEGDPNILAMALRELGAAIGQPDMKALIYQMLDGATVKAKDAPKAVCLMEGVNIEIYKAHFRGKIGEQLQLAWFALVENFQNFSEALPGVAAMLQQAQAQGQSLNLRTVMTGGSAS